MVAARARYPLPNRTRFIANHIKTEDRPALDIGWDEGILDDGRPYRAEAWAQDGITMLTVFFSTAGIEDAACSELVEYLEHQGLVHFVSDQGRAYVGARVMEDDGGEAMWSVNIVLADENDTYAQDATSLKPHLVHAPESGPEAAGAADAAGLLRALRFAADRHRFQRRKGKEASPYINHPIAVAETLARFGVTDPITLQAALLHDTLEDTETRARELEEAFGPHVRDVVAEVTDDKRKPKEMRRELQRLKAPQLSARAQLVRIADKISNVMDVVCFPPEGWTWQRRREYLDWTESVVAGCRGRNAALEAHYDQVLASAREALEKQSAETDPSQPGGSGPRTGPPATDP